MSVYAVQFQCRPWSCNGQQLIRALKVDPGVYQGDICVLPDYTAPVKCRVYIENTDLYVTVLEDEYVAPADYEECVKLHIVNGWINTPQKALEGAKLIPLIRQSIPLEVRFTTAQTELKKVPFTKRIIQRLSIRKLASLFV